MRRKGYHYHPAANKVVRGWAQGLFNLALAAGPDGQVVISRQDALRFRRVTGHELSEMLSDYSGRAAHILEVADMESFDQGMIWTEEVADKEFPAGPGDTDQD